MPATPVTQLKVTVPETLHRQLKVLAAQTGSTMNALVQEALTQFLKRRGAK
jgi:predicted HicB family RNase H-like nuclease